MRHGHYPRPYDPKTYGAPSSLPPDQKELNRLLQLWATRDTMKKVILLRTYAETNIRIAITLLAPKIGEIIFQIDGRGHGLPLLLVRQSAVKEHLAQRQNQGEEAVINHLSGEPHEMSVSSTIYKEWRLSRGSVKERQEVTAQNRMLQTTFNNLVGGARFKTL